MRFPIFLVFWYISCGRGKSPSKSDRIDELRGRYEAAKVDFDAPGWPSTEDNDGALWAGLATRAGLNVQVSAAVQSDGRVTRRPFKDSLVPSESASSISNDMILGVISGLHSQGDLRNLQVIFQYGKINLWVMGYPGYMVGRVVLKPNNIALLAKTIKHLGGPEYPERLIPLAYVPLQDSDYPTHLQLVSFLLAKDLGEGVLSEWVVQETCTYNTRDAFAMAVCGRYSEAADLLLGDYEYPAYVRGSQAYNRVHWLLAAKVVLEGH